MIKDLVTVIVACYNGEKFIEQCFNCILRQTYKNIEVVFGDDGSKDNSFEYAKSFIPNLAEYGITLKCFTQNNIGMVTNRALALAQGEYITVYDVDDILYPESIEKRVFLMKSHPEYACVRSNGYKKDQKGNLTLFVTDEKEKWNEDIFEDLLLGRTNNWAGSYMVRRSVLDEVYKDKKVFETKYGANMQVLMAVAYQHKAGFVDEPLMEYMYNTTSVTNSNHNYEADRNKFDNFKLIREAILEHLGIRTQYQHKLDVVYLKIYLDLDLSFNKVTEFLFDYETLKKIEKPLLIYTYNYYRLKGDKVMALLTRMKMLITKFL